MQRFKLLLSASTDLSGVVGGLRASFRDSKLTGAEYEEFFDRVEVEATDLTRRGRELVSMGSTFRVKKDFKFKNCSVLLDVDFSPERPSLLRKVRRLFGKG